MKRATPVFLLTALTATTGWGQNVTVTSTTIAQMWTQEIPGFEKQTFAPATQFLGIDAGRVAMDGLSLHLFGWGRVDLRDQSNFDGKSGGDLTYGYLKYRFAKANAELKAGRFMVNQGVGLEQVDGVSARADLRGGFTVSAFAGRPVLYKTLDAVTQKDYEVQRDVILGARVGLRVPRLGELGFSYLQDGSKAAKDLKVPSATDYSRKQVGADLKLTLTTQVDVLGRTVLDVASHADPLPGQKKPAKVAEHDYHMNVRFSPAVALSGFYTERNFFAFFAGTSMPTLFRQDERDQFRAVGGALTAKIGSEWQLVVDLKGTKRQSFGETTRFGGELRYSPKGTKIQSGFGYHHIDADKVLAVSGLNPTYSLVHHELRAWTMVSGQKWSLSLDGIAFNFEDRNNPYLNGETTLYEVVGSLGYQKSSAFKVSADLSVGTNATARNEVRGLLRLEYRFGFGGGQK